MLALMVVKHTVENPSNVLQSSNSPNDASNSHDTGFGTPLDDITIEQGDEHTKQITGGPQASIMSVENPEAFSQIFLCSTC